MWYMGIILNWCTGCSSYKKKYCGILAWYSSALVEKQESLHFTGTCTVLTRRNVESQLLFLPKLVISIRQEVNQNTISLSSNPSSGKSSQAIGIYHWCNPVTEWINFCAALLHVTSVLVSADFLHLDLISEKTSSHICNCYIYLLIPKIKLVILLTVYHTILRWGFGEFGIESTNNPPNSYFFKFSSLVCLIL